MGDFIGPVREVKRLRRAATECAQCERRIETGEPALYQFQRYEGGPYGIYYHPDCLEAAQAYAVAHDLYGEDWPWLAHMDEPEERAWIAERFPTVAARLSWEPEPEEADD